MHGKLLSLAMLWSELFSLVHFPDRVRRSHISATRERCPGESKISLAGSWATGTQLGERAHSSQAAGRPRPGRPEGQREPLSGDRTRKPLGRLAGQ